jgi:hypothetical protein
MALLRRGRDDAKRGCATLPERTFEWALLPCRLVAKPP